MAAPTFPTSPTNGQEYTLGGRTWVWDSTLGTWDELAVTQAIVNDTTPQLGGDLDTNSHEIVFPAELGDKVTLYDGGAGADFKMGVAPFTIYADTGVSGGFEVREAGGAAHTRAEAAGLTIPAGSATTHAAQRDYVDTALDAKADLETGKVPTSQLPGITILGILDPAETPTTAGVYLRRSSTVKSHLAAGSFVSTDNVGVATITLTENVPTGSLLVVGAVWGGDTYNMSTVVDDSGNSWTFNTRINTTVAAHTTSQIFHTVVTSPLSIGDTITLTKSNAGSSFIAHAVVISGYTGTKDANPTQTGSGVSSPTFTTIAANTDSVLLAVVSSWDTRPAASFTGGFAAVANSTSTGGTSPRSGALLIQHVSAAGDITGGCTFTGGTSSYTINQIEFT